MAKLGYNIIAGIAKLIGRAKADNVPRVILPGDTIEFILNRGGVRAPLVNADTDPPIPMTLTIPSPPAFTGTVDAVAIQLSAKLSIRMIDEAGLTDAQLAAITKRDLAGQIQRTDENPWD